MSDEVVTCAFCATEHKMLPRTDGGPGLSAPPGWNPVSRKRLVACPDCADWFHEALRSAESSILRGMSRGNHLT